LDVFGDVYLFARLLLIAAGGTHVGLENLTLKLSHRVTAGLVASSDTFISRQTSVRIPVLSP
jgi:hypothetical protein